MEMESPARVILSGKTSEMSFRLQVLQNDEKEICHDESGGNRQSHEGRCEQLRRTEVRRRYFAKKRCIQTFLKD